LRYYAKARHRLGEPVQPVDRATDAEVLGLLRACRSARDRLIVLLMARAGLRRGEVVGLRRGDLHFVVDATGLGCPVQGAHLHVVRRDNINGAWAKSRRSRMVPVDSLVVQANDDYVAERHRCRRQGIVPSCWSICSANRWVRRWCLGRSTNCCNGCHVGRSWTGRFIRTCRGMDSGAA